MFIFQRNTASSSICRYTWRQLRECRGPLLERLLIVERRKTKTIISDADRFSWEIASDFFDNLLSHLGHFFEEDFVSIWSTQCSYFWRDLDFAVSYALTRHRFPGSLCCALSLQENYRYLTMLHAVLQLHSDESLQGNRSRRTSRVKATSCDELKNV